MKEHLSPSPPQEEDKTRPDVTHETRNIGAVPELIPEPKFKPPLTGKTLDPDFRVDLTAPDAIDQLDKLSDEIAKRQLPDPDSTRDNEYPTEEELKKEEEEDAARDTAPKNPLLEASEGPLDGISDEKAKKLREENAGSNYDEDEWDDEPTKVDPPRPAA